MKGKKTHYNNDCDNNILKFLFFYWYYQLNPVEHVADDEALTYVLANLTAKTEKSAGPAETDGPCP